MIRYLYAADCEAHPNLIDQMFQHRAAQFRDRLCWEVEVDSMGWETDEYDRANPIYVIAETADGGHAGSMRFLPTTGPTMLEEHFAHLTDGVSIRSPFIWECTRFCLAPDAPRNTAALLLAGAAELGRGMGLSHALGVFDCRMPRVYKRLGWEPDVMGTADDISAGIWAFETDRRVDLAKRAGLKLETLRFWFDSAFGALPQMAH